MDRRRSLVGIGVVVALGVVVGACGGDEPSPATAPTTTTTLATTTSLDAQEVIDSYCAVVDDTEAAYRSATNAQAKYDLFLEAIQRRRDAAPPSIRADHELHARYLLEMSEEERARPSVQAQGDAAVQRISSFIRARCGFSASAAPR